MNICLATVHSSPAFTPLALLYLKAFLLEQKSLSADAVGILEFKPGDMPDAIAQRVLDQSPDLLGLSCYVWNIKTLLAAAQQIKARQPGICIVLGGPEVGPVARSVLERNPCVDCIVKSEGELPFADIVETLANGGALATVNGICLRRGNDIIETEDAPTLHDLNTLASPSRLADFDPKGRVICIETQRGCVFRCNFCFYNKDLSIRNRRFDLDRVKQEIQYWLQQDIAEIYLMDPIFNLNAARAKEICRFISEHNPRRIAFHTEVWAEFIDAELARLMQAANFRFLEVGLQTTDQAVLATVERRLRLAQFLEGIEQLKRYELPFELQLIYGLPGETRASFRASLDFAASLRAPELSVFPLMVLPGTELRRKAAALGIEYDPEPPYYIRSHRSMNAEDIAYGLKLSKAVDSAGESWTVRLLAREAGVTYADVMDEWMIWADAQDAGSPARVAAGKGEMIERFILHFCAKRQIPPEFYQASSSLEFGAKPRSATAAA